MEKLSIVEALCIIQSGVSNNDERVLYDDAFDVVVKEGKRLKLIHKKELIDLELAKGMEGQQQGYSGEDVPNNLESVLAKITHQNDLGLSQWYEVVYYDNETEKWCCYSGSKTFQDGERVVAWKYCKDCL
jgi:hypothetical protein